MMAYVHAMGPQFLVAEGMRRSGRLASDDDVLMRMVRSLLTRRRAKMERPAVQQARREVSVLLGARR